MTFSIFIPGEPCAQGRPRFARRGKFVVAYDPPKSRSWKQCAQAHMAEQRMRVVAPLAAGPIRISIVARFTCPKGDWRKTPPGAPERPHAKRPDLENVTKAVLDAGTGVLWVDDSQIYFLNAKKLIAAQGAAPGVELIVEAE